MIWLTGWMMFQDHCLQSWNISRYIRKYYSPTHSICCFFSSFQKHFDSWKQPDISDTTYLAIYLKVAFPCHKTGPSPPYIVYILFWIPQWSLKVAQVFTWRRGAAWGKQETTMSPVSPVPKLTSSRVAQKEYILWKHIPL